MIDIGTMIKCVTKSLIKFDCDLNNERNERIRKHQF